MTELAFPLDSEDAAWASLHTPLTNTQLKEFCQDIERLFRINPYLEFSRWQKRDENRYQLSGRNISQVPAFEFNYEITVNPIPDGIRIDYSQGLKTSTCFRFEPTDAGCKLTIIEDYSGQPQSVREQHLNEVDKSLVTWANDIQQYILTWQRWSWFTPWRWYMRHIWLPLKPTGRRIVYMLIWITTVEIALIALGAGIYWAEFT